MTKELTTSGKYQGIKKLFEDSEKAIISILPDQMDLKRMVGGIMMQTRVNPALLECTGQSILICGMTAFSLGLETTPALHQVALVPFSRSVQVGEQWKKIKEAQLMIEYRGLIVLALRSGEVAMIDSYLVYENEIKEGLFTIEYGLNPKVIHSPTLPPSKRGDVSGVYAVASFRDGTKKFNFMWLEEVYKRRDSSKAYKSDIQYKKTDSPWLAWEEEMIKKTAIKGLARTLQLSPIKSQFNRAVSLDNMAIGGKSQIPYLADEIPGMDVEHSFIEHEPRENEQSVTLDEDDFGKASEGGGPEEEKDKTKKTTTIPPKQKAKKSPTKKEQPAEKKTEEKKPENHSVEGDKKVDKSSDARERVAKVLSDTKLSREGYSLADRALSTAKLPCTDINVFKPEMMKTPAVPYNYIEAIDKEFEKRGLYK